MGQVIDFHPLGPAGGDPHDILLLDLLSNNSVDPHPTSLQAIRQQRRAELADAMKATGDQRTVRKLRRCGTASIATETPEGMTWTPMGCHAAYCPVCNARKASRIFHAMAPRIRDIMGARGGFLHLVLTAPDHSALGSPMPLAERLRALLALARKALATYRWKNHFSAQIGTVFFAEIGKGSKNQGHPHIHLYACAGTLAILETFALWLSDRWQNLVPDALPLQVRNRGRVEGSMDWARTLRYALKGSNPTPDWGSELLFAVVGALSSNLHLMTAQGLLKGNWSGSKGKKKAMVDEAA